MKAAITAPVALLLVVFCSDAVLACECHGCGCKGGPGWRDQQGRCVSYKKMKAVCGEPPTRSCSYEGASQICPSERRMTDPPAKQVPDS